MLRTDNAVPELSSSAIPERCRACSLKGARLCRAIAEEAALAMYAPITRTFHQGIQIVREGEPARFLGVVRSGYGREGRMRLNGDRVIFGLAAPGDIVGGLPGRESAFSLEAATDIEICMFDIRTVERLMTDSTGFRQLIVHEADARHHRLLEAIWRYGTLQSRERIIAFLVAATRLMPTEEQPDGSLVLTIEVPRRDWAELTNTTVETISRTMRYLAEKQMVTRLARHRFRIRDLDRLALLAGIEPPEPSEASAECHDRIDARGSGFARMSAVNAAGGRTGKVYTIPKQRTARQRGLGNGSYRSVKEEIRH